MPTPRNWKAEIFASLAIFTLAASAIAANAQATQDMCVTGARGFIGTGVMQKAGRPFTATIKTTFEQNLADGNVIHGSTIIHQARDSSGKTRNETAQECLRGEDGQMHLRVSVSVFDPATRTSTFWDVGGPVGRVIHMSHLDEMPAMKLTPEEMAEQRKWAQFRQPSRNESKTEQLGNKTIAGVTAEGTLTTRTIRPGAEGNDLPLVMTTEIWRSRDLSLTLSETHFDPRRGKTATEVEELTPGEPDPALFTPPAGYRVEDQKVTITIVPPAQKQ